MLDTFAELRYRADPRTMIAETKADALGFAGHAARARPGALVAVAALIGAVAAHRLGRPKPKDAAPPDEKAKDQAGQATIADDAS